MKELPELVPGMCAAIVESSLSEHGGKRFSMQRVTVMGSCRCTRKATEKVGHLDCCKVHARMAREGVIAASGVVAPKATIADIRRYRDKWPDGYYTWAKNT